MSRSLLYAQYVTSGARDGHPHLRCAPAAGPRPDANQIPPSSGFAPLAGSAWGGKTALSTKTAPAGPERHAGSGGAPRQAAGWETEARSVPLFVARSVNTEGPRP